MARERLAEEPEARPGPKSGSGLRSRPAVIVVICAAALTLAVWQVARSLRSNEVVLTDPQINQGISEAKSDEQTLRGMTVSQLKEEIARRQSAYAKARQGSDAVATAKAEDMFFRAKEELHLAELDPARR